MQKYFHWKGRARRSEYFTTFFVFNLISVLIDALGSTVPESSSYYHVVSIIILIPLLVLSYMGICLVVRRLHDLNLPGWSYLAGVAALLLLTGIAHFTFIPDLFIVIMVLGVFASLALLFMKGTVGDNKYGPDPLALATPATTDEPTTRSYSDSDSAL